MINLVYPYEDSMLHLLCEYENQKNVIEYLVVPPAWIKNINTDSKKITENYKLAIEKVECAIFLEPSYIEFIYHDIIDKMKYAIDKRKKIICLVMLQDEDKANLIEYADRQKVTIEFMDGSVKEVFHYYNNLQSIIVGVGSTIGQLDTLKVLIKLKKQFSEKGYRVAVISTNINGKILGYYYLDCLKHKFKVKEIVVDINRFINNSQYDKQADIILVQIPGSMLNYSKLAGEDFSVESYIFSRAIDFDYFIFSSTVDEGLIGNFDFLSQTFQYRYGFGINAILVDNCIIDYSNELEDEELLLKINDKNNSMSYIENLKMYEPDLLFGNMEDDGFYKTIFEDCENKITRIDI